MAKSEEIPIVTPHRDYDNPFNDQTAFSPPQAHKFVLDSNRGPLGGAAKFTLEGRERSASQPTSEQLRNCPKGPFDPSPLSRPTDERMNSDPNLTTGNSRLFAPPTSGLHPIDRAFSTPIRDAVDAEGIRGFYSAPVTPCQTPIGSRQGSPKAERKKTGGLLGAIFGAGIYGRQTSEGTPGLLGHVAEDNEDDFTPVGSPSNFTIDELKTRLRGVDDDGGSFKTNVDDAFQFPRQKSVAEAAAGAVIPAPTVTNVVKSKSKKKKEREAELDYSYRELTIITPSSM